MPASGEATSSVRLDKQDTKLHRQKKKRGPGRPLIVLGSWPMLIGSTILFCATLVIVQRDTMFESVHLNRRTTKDSLKNDLKNKNGYVRQPVVYGHVHMAKTAGSTVNGELAMHYERVCGNKGYSYDAYQANLRFNRTHKAQMTIRDHVDSISKIRPTYNRGRMPQTIMNEIGYEDCDYISMEGHWEKFWVKQFASWHEPLELHVPCREPIDHFMSEWNHRHARNPFRCRPTQKSKTSLSQVKESLTTMDRFSMALVNDHDNIHVKCFDYQNLSEYINYMGEKLQPKRVAGDYVFRSTNKPRDKRQECIWYDTQVRETVKAYLIENYDYYRFCNDCLGSQDDLLLQP